MMGLLDALSDPALMAQVEERRQLVQHLADWAGCNYADARSWLEQQEAHAMEVAQQRLIVGPEVPAEHSYH